MPPRGVKKGTKRARQYEKVKKSEQQQGRSESRAEEIAARTVNKAKARAGESRTRSRSSTKDMSSGRRGGYLTRQAVSVPTATPSLARTPRAASRARGAA